MKIKKRHIVLATLTKTNRLERANDLKGQALDIPTSKAYKIASPMRWTFFNKRSALAFAKRARTSPNNFVKVIVRSVPLGSIMEKRK